MKLTPTQRLLAGMAVKLRQEQMDVLKSLSTLPEGVKASINSPIKFLTVLRQHCGTVAEFIPKLDEMLSTGTSFTDLQTFGRSLYRQCGENDLSTRSTHFPVGMANYRPSQAQSMCFNSTLLKISESVAPDAVEIMVTVTPIPDASKERLRSGHSLFSKMKECGCISENDTDFLEDLMREMKLIKALEILEHYKQKHPPVKYPPFVSQQPVPRPTPENTSTPYSSLPAQLSQQGGVVGGVARMASMPEAGSSQLVLGRNLVRSTSNNYLGTMSSVNPSSMPSENPSSMFSGNSSSLSSGNSCSLSANVGSGYQSLDDRSLLPIMPPLSSNRFPQRGPPSDTGSSDDFRTAPGSPAMASPPMQYKGPIDFTKPASFPSSFPPSLSSSVNGKQQQHYMSTPHNPMYASPTVRIPLEVTPQSPQASRTEPGGPRDPEPSAPSRQVVESLHRQPPTNPHYTAQSSGGTPGAQSSPVVQSSPQVKTLESYISPTMNSNLNSNVFPVSSNVPSVSSNASVSSLPLDVPSHAALPQQRQDTGPHQMVEGFTNQPVSLLGVVVPQPTPRRASQRQAASRRASQPQGPQGTSMTQRSTSLRQQREERTSQHHGREGSTSHPRTTFQSANANPLPRSTSQFQSIPNAMSRTQSEPHTASYTGRSDDSLFPPAVQDVQGQLAPQVSEIGQSEGMSTGSLRSYPASFEDKLPHPVEIQREGGVVSLVGLSPLHQNLGNGVGAQNGCHVYQAPPPRQAQNGFHQHGNGPGTVRLHSSLYQQGGLSGPKQFVNQAGLSDEYNSIVPMDIRQPAGSRRSVLDRQEATTHASMRGACGRVPGAYESINEPAILNPVRQHPNPTHGSPNPTHQAEGSHYLSRSESGGEIAQCSDPLPVAATRNVLYPTLPSQRSLRKRKANSSELEVSGSTPKRSRNLEEEKAQKCHKAEMMSSGDQSNAKSSSSLKGVWNSFWGRFAGSKSGKVATSSGEQATSGDSENQEQTRSVDVEEQDDEDFHSCNEDEEN